MPLANKIRLLAKLMALARMGIYKMDMLNKNFLMNCRKCFVYCKSLCLSNFSNIFHWRPSLIRSGRFSHLPPNVKMTLSMAIIVWALPLKGHNIRNTWSFHRSRIQRERYRDVHRSYIKKSTLYAPTPQNGQTNILWGWRLKG